MNEAQGAENKEIKEKNPMESGERREPIREQGPPPRRAADDRSGDDSGPRPFRSDSRPGGGDRSGGDRSGGDRSGGDRSGDSRNGGGRPDHRRPRRKFFYRRRKFCKFKAEKIDYIDFKDVELLRSFTPERGKIMPRRQTGTSAKFQRMLAKAIKRARQIAILPYTKD